MTVSTRSLASALADAAGAGGVADDEAARATATVDGVVPRWLVRARDTGQVSAVLALAWEESLAVVPRGSGSALDGGCPLSRVDIVLDLRGMNRVVDYNPDDLTATVEAGITTDALASVLAPRRQLLPVDPPGAGSRTLGGLVATAARGPLRLRYGTLRDLLLGVRFVQSDGVVTWGGARVVKSVTGYDVPKLMVGALGTLGVLCELTLRLHPRPEAEATRLVAFDSLDAAAAFVARIVDSSLEPQRLELFDASAAHGVGAAPRVSVAVAVASVEAAVRAATARIDALALATGGSSAAAPEGFWAAHAAMVTRAGATLAIEISSAPSDLVATLRGIERALGDLPPAAPALVTGCAALGSLDVLLPPAAVPAAAAVVARLREVVGARGGHVVVRRAPVAVRRVVDPWGPVEPGALGLMTALRDEFDPRRVLNPGRFVGGQ